MPEKYIAQRRHDGTFVIKDGTYHVPNEGAWAAQWDALNVQWQADPNRFEQLAPPPEPEPPTIEEQRAAIDAETSAAIIGGFEYVVRGEKLHFNYDAFDQQNFSDTANACILAIQGVPGLPENVKWNAYRDGHLLRVIFSATEFLTLYTAGALAHKVTQMEIGGQRKAALDEKEPAV